MMPPGGNEQNPNILKGNKDGPMQYVALEGLSVQQANEALATSQGKLQVATEQLKAFRISAKALSESKEAIGMIDSHGEEGEGLVPITGGVYAPGTILDPHKFVLDIGGGYMVEMTASEAKEHLDKRLEIIYEKEASAIAQTINVSNLVASIQNHLSTLEQASRAGQPQQTPA